MVVKVIDGDTIDVARPGETAKERIRLIGVDTPETKDPRKPVQCFGKEASEFTSRLIGRTVWLEYDVERKDRYGRTLAHVFLDDGAFFNLILAEEGYAQPLTIPPNVRYADRFVEGARKAREEGRGLWSSCG
ncbi:MAG: nuclease [Acidobacteria bacterium]|nr:MAG: nuclease [Acidobacteriota bacterium]